MTVLLVALLLVAVAVGHDLAKRVIPDWISIALVLVAIGAGVLGVEGGPSWGSRGLGLAAGLTFGAAMFKANAFGGGDAKLLASLGAVLGLKDFLWLLLFMALSGGVLALIAKARGRRDIAYAPAIAFGLAAVTAITGVMRHVQLR